MNSGHAPAAEHDTASSKRDLLGSKLHYDDRIDTDTNISAGEALKLLIRALKVMSAVKGLFSAKFLLTVGALAPGILLPWVSKIVIDNVVRQEPFGETDIRYPPFLDPLIAFLEGMEPMGIMLTLTVMFAILLIVVGARIGGTGASLFGGSPFTGSDEAVQAENKISEGWSEAGGIWGLIEYWIHVRMSQRIANKLRTRLFQRLTRLPMTALDDQRIGDAIYRVLYDSAIVPHACYDLAILPFTTILGALINMYLMKYSYGTVSPEIVWVAWAMLPVAFVITYPASGLLRRVHQTKRSAGSATTNAMEETMGNISAVQSLGGMEREKERFAERSAESYKRERIAMLVGILLFALGAVAAIIGAIYVAFTITNRIIEDVMTPGDFGVLFGIFFGLVGSAVEIGVYWVGLQTKVAPLRRVFFFIDYESDDDREGGIKLPAIRQKVAFENVDYVYPNGKQALREINLELNVGELVAIVGPTGSGKTSLAYLIPSFLVPTRGRVLIDGQDISRVDLGTLRGQVAYVFQEHLLLSESIRENLLLANPQATEAEIASALERSGCMDFIESLPTGIDTVLGRSGDTLSVGQQQRLSIARGLIRNARILVLDEPTAGLDPKTENALVKGLRETSRSRLVIVIAHRLSTIRQADRIIFLDDGEVKDIGNHDALMAKEDSPYRRFVELQEGQGKR